MTRGLSSTELTCQSRRSIRSVTPPQLGLGGRDSASRVRECAHSRSVHHLCPQTRRLRLSGGNHRLIQPVRSVQGSIRNDGEGSVRVGTKPGVADSFASLGGGLFLLSSGESTMGYKTYEEAETSLIGTNEGIRIIACLISVISSTFALYSLRCGSCGVKWELELARGECHALTCPSCGKKGIADGGKVDTQ